MNALPQPITTLASLFAITSSLISLGSAQDVRRSGQTPSTTQTATTTGTQAPAVNATTTDLTQGVFIPSIDAKDHSLSRYAGQKLLNTQGAELGTIKDFIVHAPSSRVRHIVVSSGGILGGMGNSLRLVPVEAVQRENTRNDLTVDILHSAWLQVPPISDELYVTDQFNISPAQHQQMVQRFGSASQAPRPASTSAAPAASAPGETTGLIRATALRDRTVRAGDARVGEIENIIVDLKRGTAAALIDSSGEFTGTTGKYLIPLSRLVYDNPRQNPIGTTLTRADFAGARMSVFVPSEIAAAPQTRATEEQPLTPTGRTDPSAAVNPVSDSLAASAREIRRAIDKDPVLVAESIQVSPENGKIVLRGSVRTEAARKNLENVVRALPAGSIENRVTVNP